ncbi:hypothetical protein NP493_599g02002 [Ridgeia piscesae]|uniref:Uncharacterized protein n=1 Tax=Ridgeia piscesae TaxID=27915 RepID=A0AAD9KTI7_RIDPI|nr:hypothetical protein NP493_599g02002 [Ridgeia piscesae]
MEMRCLRKLLGITYRDHISNEEVRNRTRQAIGPHEDLLTTVKRRKLKWAQCKEGKDEEDRKKIWEDNIPEWTVMTLGAATRKAYSILGILRGDPQFLHVPSDASSHLPLGLFLDRQKTVVHMTARIFFADDI